MNHKRWIPVASALLCIFLLWWAVMTLLKPPNSWWLNPDFGRLRHQLHACDSDAFTSRRHCAAAVQMAQEALNAMAACPRSTDAQLLSRQHLGCPVVRSVMAEQHDSLDAIFKTAALQPPKPPNIWFGWSQNEWLQATANPLALDEALVMGLPAHWVLLLVVSCLVLPRGVYLYDIWLREKNRESALTAELSELNDEHKRLTVQVDWLGDLYACLKMPPSEQLQLGRQAGANAGAGPLRNAMDSLFPPPVSRQDAGKISPTAQARAGWQILQSATPVNGQASTHRLLHLETGIVVKVTAHTSKTREDDTELWYFSANLDAVVNRLTYARPAELRAGHLEADWLTTWSAADTGLDVLEAAMHWVEGVLMQAVEVQDGTLSTAVEHRLRRQRDTVARSRQRKRDELRSLRNELTHGCLRWCLKRSLWRQRVVDDADVTTWVAGS